MIRESLQGIIDESQFYQKSTSEKNSAKLYFSHEDHAIDIDVDFIEVNRKEREIELRFECNAHVTGEILDGDFCRIDINFLGYNFTRKINAVKKTYVDFSAGDLCIVTLTFEFSSPI